MSLDTYFRRYAYPEIWLKQKPANSTGLIVTIPAFNEESVVPALESLRRCDLPDCGVEIILVINAPENAPGEVRHRNSLCHEEAVNWIEAHCSERFQGHIINAVSLPPKDHGVGLARKIGMDEALHRLNSINKVDDGIIACFDADSRCSPDYLTAIYRHFKSNKKCPGISVYFEHPLDDIKDAELLSGIIQYELHLRYYIHAQRFSGFPNAFHAIGSSMAVRAKAYYMQGGMNKRKAGEDFYFLHKIIALGNFQELRETTVFPQPRESDRVPFGTGRALKDWMSSSNDIYLTYSPESFVEIRNLFLNLKNLYTGKQLSDSFPDCLKSFLREESFEEKLQDMKARTADFSTFEKRFYSWFNAFKMMKFVHFSRDNYHQNIPVAEASKWLLNNYFRLMVSSDDPAILLGIYRNIDKTGSKQMI